MKLQIAVSRASLIFQKDFQMLLTLKDHNGNKGNHFLFFVSSWVVISKPWDFANFKILYMYFKCVFNILLYCFMLLICDTKINNNK